MHQPLIAKVTAAGDDLGECVSGPGAWSYEYVYLCECRKKDRSDRRKQRHAKKTKSIISHNLKKPKQISRLCLKINYLLIN